MNHDTPPPADAPAPHQPYIPDSESPPEFTWPAVLSGALFGIIFGASSLYLFLKVSMTVSASVPIAVLSITLFRAFSKGFGFRRATILENNIVQTTGSAGESIAFGVGVTMPALLLLGFEMDPVRVMTVSVLGGLLGILMMIPLRRAFIVKQHGKLKYPEGTACAEVLIAGEKGGSTARMVFLGFGIAAVYTTLMKACKFWAPEPTQNLYDKADDGATTGLKGAAVGGELSPELLGVGYIIGPRVACLMLGGAIISYLVLGPMIATFGQHSSQPVLPAEWKDSAHAATDPGLIPNMDPNDLRKKYLQYIGAGAVATAGIISLFRALPLIIGSVVSGLRDLRASRQGGAPSSGRTDSDMPMTVVLYGSIALVLIIALVPQLGLGFSVQGILGALMILLFGFLFVTVSSRLTGEVGSSSNPISGMTIATLLLVCIIFFVLGKRDAPAMLTALTVAAVVCIASSNGGTTSQDLKTGFLVGATPRKQQWAILVGALTSAVAIGGVMLAMNSARTHYTKKGLPDKPLVVEADAPTQKVGRPYADNDQATYRIVHVRRDDRDNPGVTPGRYLVNGEGRAAYRTDMPVNQQEKKMDGDAGDAPEAFKAAQPALVASIIEGILGGKLEWGLIAIGGLIAVALELLGVSALPVAVGMYIPFSSTLPVFLGGMVRAVVNALTGTGKSEAESETSPSVLLASGYIAGGTLCGLILTFFNFAPEFNKSLEIGPGIWSRVLPQWDWDVEVGLAPKVVALIMYALLIAVLLWIGLRSRAGPTDRP